MRILIGLILLVFLVGGCMSQQQRIQQREALVARFTRAYPDTWRAELLKYDLKENQRRSDQWDQALKDLAEQGEKAREMRGGRIRYNNTNTNNNSTRWQERNAKEQMAERYMRNIRNSEYGY